MDDFRLNARVTIICDDPDTRFTWAGLLRSKGIDVRLLNGYISEVKDNETEQDLIIIDETLSKFDGVKLIKKLRETQASTIFYVTLQSKESHILRAYEAGADDFYVKPISPAIFLKKVRSLLHRSHSIPVTGLEIVQSSDLVLEVNRRVVIINPEKEIRLSKLEFLLLYCMIKSPGRVFTTEQLIAAVWGYTGTGDQRLLKHLVFRLRQKLEDNPKNPKYVRTETGIGYKFINAEYKSPLA